MVIISHKEVSTIFRFVDMLLSALFTLMEINLLKMCMQSKTGYEKWLVSSETVF